jgi:hypothetical protein
VSRWKQNLQRAPGGVRIVDLPRANHDVFLSNEADVLREIRSFLTRVNERRWHMSTLRSVDWQAQFIRLILILLGAALAIVGWARWAGR